MSTSKIKQAMIHCEKNFPFDKKVTETFHFKPDEKKVFEITHLLMRLYRNLNMHYTLLNMYLAIGTSDDKNQLKIHTETFIIWIFKLAEILELDLSKVQEPRGSPGWENQYFHAIALTLGQISNDSANYWLSKKFDKQQTQKLVEKLWQQFFKITYIQGYPWKMNELLNSIIKPD